MELKLLQVIYNRNLVLETRRKKKNLKDYNYEIIGDIQRRL